MANPLYQMLTGNTASQMPMPAMNPAAMNPFQKFNMISQAMQNPQAFVRQAFPDIPDEISNDPNRILSYLQQTRGITNQQLQQVAQNGGIG